MKSARDTKEIESIKNNILNEALNIIGAEGFNSLTMRTLAKKSGMSAPNLYNYYSSKDEIYISIIITGFQMLHAELSKAYDEHSEPSAKARAAIEAYINFGVQKSAYYDIMFTAATPKYNDYVGTPLEQLSAIEYKLSMDIAEIASRLATDLLGEGLDSETKTRRVIEVWSLLHGMVSLHNSNIVGYVAEDVMTVYQGVIGDILEILNRRGDR